MLMGALDFGHTLYMESVLQGAVQKAARDGTLQQTAGTDETARNTIDTAVRNQVKTLHKQATVTIARRFYRTFTDAAAAAAETFTTPTKTVSAITASRSRTATATAFAIRTALTRSIMPARATMWSTA